MTVTKEEYDGLIRNKPKWDIKEGIRVVPLKVLEFEVTQKGIKVLKLPSNA